MRGLIITAVIIATLLATAKYILLPSRVQSQLRQQVASCWDGKIEMGTIDFGLRDGRVNVHQVRLYDRSGRLWLELPEMALALAGWPSMAPDTQSVAILRPVAHLYVDDGGLKLPFKAAAASTSMPATEPTLVPASPTAATASMGDSGGFRRLSIIDGQAVLKDIHDQTFGVKNVNFSMNAQADGAFCVQLRTPQAAVDGTIDFSSWRAGLNVGAKGEIDRDLSALLLEAFSVDVVRSCGGWFELSGTLTGVLTDVRQLECQGHIRIDDGEIVGSKDVLADKLFLAVQCNGSAAQVQDVTMQLLGGQASGKGTVEWNPSKTSRYNGEFNFKNVSMSKVKKAFDLAGRFNRGVASGEYSFAGPSGASDLCGKGMIFLDDADMMGTHVVPNIFAFFGNLSVDSLKKADALAVFRHRGATVELMRAGVSNNLSAIQVEPGGRVDVQHGTMDFYVIGVPVESLRDVLVKVPVINWFVSLKDKLTRLHVKGHFSDPPSRLITKEPLKDLSVGTVDFFHDAAKGSGELGRDILNSFTRTLKTVETLSR